MHSSTWLARDKVYVFAATPSMRNHSIIEQTRKTRHDKGVLQSAVSQQMKPSRNKKLYRLLMYFLTLVVVSLDFIHVVTKLNPPLAQPSKLHNDRQITSLLLRAPEALLGGEWDMPADIWTFGCLVCCLRAYDDASDQYFRYMR